MRLVLRGREDGSVRWNSMGSVDSRSFMMQGGLLKTRRDQSGEEAGPSGETSLACRLGEAKGSDEQARTLCGSTSAALYLINVHFLLMPTGRGPPPPGRLSMTSGSPPIKSRRA